MDDNLKNLLMNFQAMPLSPTEKTDLTEYTKISFEAIVSLGTGISILTQALNSISTQSSPIKPFPLYRAVNADGTPMRLPNLVKDGLGYATGYHNEKGLAVARMQEVGSSAKLAANIPYDPVTLFMSIALISIEQNLDEIRDTQKQILMFMEDDKRSKIQGNLKFLSGIMNDYKYNLENDTYKTNMHIKVQDIKQESEQNIIFYQSKIRKSLEKHELFVTDKNIIGKMDNLQSDFEDLRLALYSFGFSTFLDVMLLENFNPEYLNSIVQYIKDYAFKYKELYTICYNNIERSLESSIQAKLLSGVEKVAAVTKKAVYKLPKIETFLTDSDKKLNSISQSHQERIIKMFIRNKDCFVGTFVDNINTMNKLYNKPSEFLFDDKNLYIKTISE